MLQKIRYALIGAILSVGLIMGVFSWATGSTLTLTTLSEFSQVFRLIKDHYVDEVDDEQLIHDAIQGMLTKLDPHSTFLPPRQYSDLSVSTQGVFGGLGIEVNMSAGGYVEVVAPIDDTPAFRAGVKSGDLIVKLDGQPVKGLTLNEAVDKMRGKVGEPIIISIRREGKQNLLDIEIIRDRIQIQSVRSRLLEPHFGYVRISRFQGPTATQLEKHINKLIDSEGYLNGLVLDLRNNPGGLLDAAVDVSGVFLDGQEVVSTKGRSPNSKHSFKAKKGQIIEGVPMIVLIDGGSASASEIVAGALQDYDRAVIMGRTSFGKGSVQTLLSLQHSKAGVKLTTAKYYTPKGRSIQAKGIEPDIVIPLVKVERLENLPSRRSEKDLTGHIENESEESVENQSSGNQSAGNQNDDQPVSVEESQANNDDSGYEAIGLDNLLDTDYDLYMALNSLKVTAETLALKSQEKTVE